MEPLNRRQQRFVEEYLIDLNATQAAIRAGYSKKSAPSMGSELLGKPHVQEAIQAARQERSHRTGVTADRVIKELAKVAFADLSDEEDTLALRIKPADKVKSLELLGRHHGLWDKQAAQAPVQIVIDTEKL